MTDSTAEENKPDAAIDAMEVTSPAHNFNKDQEKSGPLASLLLKLWNLIMILSTMVLSFYFFVLKDNSVLPFVILGIIGLCIPPIVGMFRTMARNKRMKIEHEKRMHEAQMERIRQAREKEMARQQREKMLALNEEAIQEAIKNTDVASYKMNNSMQ